MPKQHKAEFRKEFTRHTLRSEDLRNDPFVQLNTWLVEASEGGSPDPYAMAIATLDSSGYPAVRMVLLKSVDERGLVFCTRSDSPKGHQLLAVPRAALAFYWPEVERQVRIVGDVAKVESVESEAYFAPRPRGSQLAAWVGHQSQPIAGRDFLDKGYEEARRRFEGESIPRPKNWEGYLIRPRSFEFWQGGIHRLHDRFKFTREESGWKVARLSP